MGGPPSWLPLRITQGAFRDQCIEELRDHHFLQLIIVPINLHLPLVSLQQSGGTARPSPDSLHVLPNLHLCRIGRRHPITKPQPPVLAPPSPFPDTSRLIVFSPGERQLRRDGRCSGSLSDQRAYFYSCHCGAGSTLCRHKDTCNQPLTPPRVIIIRFKNRS